MALHVNYKNRMGYCYLHSRGDENRKWKVWFCHANALCALMYFYRDEDNNLVSIEIVPEWIEEHIPAMADYYEVHKDALTLVDAGAETLYTEL